MTDNILEDAPKHSVPETLARLSSGSVPTTPPKFLLLYGSLRQTSYSRFLAEECERLLKSFGAETALYDPTNLPVFDRTSNDHPEVQKLRELSVWSDGHVWVSPEQHGSMTGVFKNQLDWIPLVDGAVRPTQGRTLAVLQVCGGSQSFNVVNSLRLLGRWMRMVTIPNQSSVAQAWREFEDDGRMKPSSYRDRVVDVMQELFKFTLLLRGHTQFLTERYSEQKQLREAGELKKGLGV